MKSLKKITESEKSIGGGVKWYREKILEMINHIENENYLLKIYSFVKVFFED